MDEAYYFARSCVKRILLIVSCLSAISHSLVLHSDAAEPDPTVAHILSAWSERAAQIHAFRFDCEITDTRFNIPRYDVGDPFSGSRDGEATVGEVVAERIDFGKTMSVRRAGDLFASSLRGEQWDYQNEERIYFATSSAFDGSSQYRLFEGRIIVGDVQNLAGADETLTNFGSHIAVHLWHTPVACLNRLGFQPDKMKIVDHHARVAGRDCLELSIPRTSKRWQGTLYVDPARNYVPVRFTMMLGKVTTSERTMEYAPNPVTGWVLAAWVDKRFTEKGAPESVERVDVTRVVLNEPSRDGDFKITFPSGALVTEHDGDRTKHFLILDNGDRRPADERAARAWKTPDPQFNELDAQIRRFGATTPAERRQILERLRDYVRGANASRLNTWLLVTGAARQLHLAEGPDAAVAYCREFAGESDVCRQSLPRIAASIEGRERRQKILGSQILLTGTTTDGQNFVWSHYNNKVVLVKFWFTGCGPCIKDLPWLKELYESNKDRGFAAIGVSADADASQLVEFIEREKIPWQTIHEPKQDPASNSLRYNVSSFPTYFLVDRAGKVVFAGAHDEELEQAIAQELSREPH
jgi:thiol-disulfide isomerase/thioredoxin